MPRHHRRRPDEPLRAVGGTSARREEYRGESYLVRSVPGAAAVKSYRCPGCNQVVPVGTPHVVAWPETAAGAEDRRHWHTSCWARRR